MKKTLLIISSIFLFSGCAVNNGPQNTNEEFRVLGYLHGNWNTEATDLTLITDLNLAFVHPDENGDFTPDPAYEKVISAAHQQNVRVFFSIGGGAPPPHLEKLLASKQGQEHFVNGIVQLLDQYNFDGVDIDLENELINAHYAPFVAAVAKAVKAKNKRVTAALASWNSDKIADSTLAQYDFINVMSYDATGPWNPEKPGPHSPYTMVENDFTYYTKTRKLAPEKILIGLPFYGYGFNGAPVSMKYKDIIENYPGSEWKDELPIGEGTIYYNGIPTIEKKTLYALEKGAAGVMIWQLLQDSKDHKSLLKTIYEVKASGLKTLNVSSE